MSRLVKHSIIAFSMSLFISCSSNEEIFTEDLYMEFPTLDLLELSESGLVDVSMTGKSSIEGFTRKFYFKSDNSIKNYAKIRGGIYFSDIVYKDKDITTIFAYNGNDFSLEIIDRTMSSNPSYRTRFRLIARENVWLDEGLYSGFIDYRSADFITQSKGWIAADYSRDSFGPNDAQFPQGIRIYEVNENSCSHICTIEGTSGLETKGIYFKDEFEGYVIAGKKYNEKAGYIFKTMDGGKTWILLYDFQMEPQSLIFTGSMDLLIECRYGYIQSNNGGTTWVSSQFENRLLWTSLFNDGILYSLEAIDQDNHGAIGRLHISEDKGRTWEQVPGSSFYGHKISFFDKLNGIAYSSSILQITHDGGQTWELLAFPINLEEE